jgi:hypothetical protein
LSAPVVAGKSPVPVHFSAVRGVRCSQCRSSHDGVSFNVRLLEGDEEAVEAATSSWDFVIKSQLSSPRWNNSSCMRVGCGPAELKAAAALEYLNVRAGWGHLEGLSLPPLPFEGWVHLFSLPDTSHQFLFELIFSPYFSEAGRVLVASWPQLSPMRRFICMRCLYSISQLTQIHLPGGAQRRDNALSPPPAHSFFIGPIVINTHMSHLAHPRCLAGR